MIIIIVGRLRCRSRVSFVYRVNYCVCLSLPFAHKIRFGIMTEDQFAVNKS